MTPQDLFGVFVRALGLFVLLVGLNLLFHGVWEGMVQAIVGVAFILAADLVVALCYTNVISNLTRRPPDEGFGEPTA